MSETAQYRADPKAAGDADPVIRQITEVVGSDRILTGEDDRAFYSQDIFAQGEIAAAVVRSRTTKDLSAAVQAATKAGYAVFPRGGGMSYTDGYIPTVAKSISVDTRAMDQILEINEADMYVTVQPGVTWAELDTALAEKGLRTPFWGPFSGMFATVGGSVSQNAVSFGSGTAGPASDSVIGLEIVLANGEVLKTGTGGGEFAKPFFRHFGPDLTGLFLGDAGSLGVKASISLRLMKRRPAIAAFSYNFASFDALAEAMSAVAREDVATEAYGMDPELNRTNLGRAEGQSTGAKLQALLAVGRSGRGPIDALRQMTRVVFSGTSAFSQVEFAAHFSVEGEDDATARAKGNLLRRACDPHGTEIDNTIPQVFRAMPFQPMNNIILHPTGMRWVPCHGILPLSETIAFHNDLQALYESYSDKMRQNKVIKAAMYTTSLNGFLYEPVFYWEDQREDFHRRVMDDEVLAQMKEFDPNPEGRALVQEMKKAIIDLFHRHGATHMQCGKVYPLLRNRNPAAVSLLKSVKSELDPHNLMNPGALGL